MATTIARLEAKLVADTRPFDRSMDKSEGKMHKVGKVAGVAGLAIAGGLAYGLEKSVHAAIDAQASQARLEQAFKSSGLSSVRYAKQVSALEKSGRKLGFTDEQVKDSLGSLLIATHNMKDASKDLSVAQDIARFKHVDLTTATKMLTMAQAGSQRATKQLGLTVERSTKFADAAHLAYKRQKEALDQATPSMSKLTKAQQDQYFAQKDNLDIQYAAAKASATLNDKTVTSERVIDLVTKKLHGQADAYSQTAAGSMEQFRAQLTHLEVSLGSALLPAMAQTAGALAKLTDFFSRHATATRVLIVATAALGVAFLTTSVYAKVMSSALVTKLIPALARTTVGQVLLNVATAAFPAVAIILALAAVGVALVIAYKKVAFFREGVQATFNWIKSNWPLLVGIIGGPIGIALEQIITKRNRIAAAFRELPGMIGNAIGGAIGVLKNKLEEIFDWHRIVGWIKSALGFGSPSPHFMAIGHAMVDSMARGVGDAAGVLKSAVFRLAKQYTVGLPGRIAGGLGLGGHPQNAMALAGEHQPGSAERYLIPWAGQEGIGVTSVATGNHVKGSYHYQHRAIDVSGTAQQMAKFFYDSIRHFGANNITELFYDPIGSYIKNGRVIRGAIGGHSDHVHIALGSGGIVTRATNALIGERGPEAVIPLSSSRGQAALAGGNTYNFSFPNYVGSQNELAAAVRDAMESFQNRNGRGGF